jgi:hypothetical protein
LERNTGKPQYNESEGTNDLFFIAGILLLLGLFTIELTPEGPEIKFFIEGILL